LIASMSETDQALNLWKLDSPDLDAVSPTRLAWVNGRFEWDRLSVAVNASGAFHIEGLAPVAYRIGAEMEAQFGNADEVARIQYMSHNDDPEFVASRDAIVIEGPRCRLRLDVRIDGIPVDGAAVVLGFGSGGMQSGFGGHLVDIVWDGERSATVRVIKPGWTSSEIVVAPADAVPGVVRVIELTRQTDSASLSSLVLRPRIACSNSADRYSVQLFRLDKNPSAPLDPFPNKTFNLSEGEWRFDNVAPGRYRIDVQALGTAADTSWCFAPRPEIKLAPGESLVRELPFISGGRLALTVLSENATAANIEVHGISGQLDWTYFDARKGETPHMTAFAGKFGVDVGVRVEITTVLEPGLLAITIALKGARRERKVDIVPGQTTELVVDFSKPDER
jgi:hypothetical protein